MSTSLTITVRFFAAARAAAGREEERVEIPGGSSVAVVVDRLGTGRPELAKVLLRCSYLLDELAVRDLADPLRDGATLDVLPPFAGG